VYVEKARRIDRQFNQTLQGQVGPVELSEIGRVYGLAFGLYCEASKSMEVLVRSLVEYRAPSLLDEGAYESVKVAKGIAVEQYRRTLAMACMKSQAVWTRAAIEKARPIRESIGKFHRFREMSA